MVSMVAILLQIRLGLLHRCLTSLKLLVTILIPLIERCELVTEDFM